MAYTTINKSTDYFNTKLYTGNGGTQAVTGVGFQPDWVWLKSRSDAYSHQLFDAVRGTTKLLTSEATDAEQTISGVTAFGTDGFTVGSDAGSNGNTKTYVSWNWKANGQGSSNTDGSINTTYTSVNTTSGFSIVSYTGNGTAGATVGHGLGVTPKFLIIKKRNATGYWVVQPPTATLTSGYLNSTGVIDNGATSNFFNNTAMGNSLFTLGSDGYVNTSGATYIAYCFAEKTGYSKFGSYTGNGNADGTFVYTGFKPSFLMVKRTDTADTWIMYDNKRIGYNANNYFLQANSNAAESSSDRFDLLSNGFKPRYDWTPINASGGTYIYMAFGQSIVGSNNIPATAR